MGLPHPCARPGGGRDAYHRLVSRLRGLFLAALVASLGGCASSPPPAVRSTPSPSPQAAPTATATPSPGPTADTEQVALLSSGVGDYYLQAFPVAVLRNQASAHTASGIVVHFAVDHPGGTFTLDSLPALSLAPGQSLAIAQLCTDSCRAATGVRVTGIDVGSWIAGGAAMIGPSPAGYACGSPCSRHSGFSGTATATVSSGSPVATETALYAAAACTNQAGTVVGGGSIFPWTWPGGASAPVAVPVLVSDPPSACEVYVAETG